MTFSDSLEIIEVAPRDGLQNLGFSVSTADKLDLLQSLIASNIRSIEVTSLPQPKVIPALADGEEVLTHIKQQYPEVICIVSALSFAGAYRALELNADAVTYLLSASEQHHMQLTRQTQEASLQSFAEFAAKKGKAKARFSISSAFVCPLQGTINPEKVVRLIEKGLNTGADEISLADTTGIAHPGQIYNLLERVKREFPHIPVNMHLHDTQGMGLANALMAFTMGFNRFETSVGGLGGNPLYPGGAGNIATEDVLNMFKSMGCSSPIDLNCLVEAAKAIKQRLSVNLSGRLANL